MGNLPLVAGQDRPVSELATNSIAASSGVRDSPLIRVWLLCDKARFLVLVWDRNPSPPIRREAGQDAEGGGACCW